MTRRTAQPRPHREGGNVSAQDRQFLQDAADAVKAKLPDNYGFIILACPFNGEGDKRLVYVSNMQREGAIASLKEWLLKCGAAEDWMKHIT